MLLVLVVVLLPFISAQQCGDAGIGPCLNGSCPDQYTCLNYLQPNELCCNSALVVTQPPTTVPTGTTAAPGACADLLNPSTGVSDCPRMASYCNNAVYYDLMTQQCPSTCGRCGTSVTTGTGTCVDKVNPSTGVSDCPNMASYCNNAVYYDLMTQECPATCGRCSGTGTGTGTVTTTCADLLNPSTGVSDCPSRAYLCNEPTYYSLMTQQYPRTCNRCSSTTGTAVTISTTTCADLLNPATGVSDCPSRAYLCNNSAYYDLMTQQCPRTCGRCTSG